MIRHWNGNRSMREFLLHDDMAASFAHFHKTVPGQNSTNLPA